MRLLLHPDFRLPRLLFSPVVELNTGLQVLDLDVHHHPSELLRWKHGIMMHIYWMFLYHYITYIQIQKNIPLLYICILYMCVFDERLGTLVKCKNTLYMHNSVILAKQLIYPLPRKIIFYLSINLFFSLQQCLYLVYCYWCVTFRRYITWMAPEESISLI